MGGCQCAQDTTSPQRGRLRTSPLPQKSSKIVLVGSQAVGKSSITTQFCDQNFPRHRDSTIGWGFRKKSIIINRSRQATEINLELWDTSGQERFRSLLPIYYNDAQIIVFVYDVTSLNTIEEVKEWIDTIINQQQDNPDLADVPMYLVGNKIDKHDQREVTYNQGKTLANEYKLQFAEISATVYEDVSKLFHKIARESLI